MSSHSAYFNRIITTHDGKSGKAVFDKNVDEHVPFVGFPVPPGKPTTSNYGLAYSTTTFPVQGLSPPTSVTPEVDANQDVKQYKSALQNPSPLNPPNGTSCTIIEVPPENNVAMHRTVTLDYGVVVDGTTQLVMGDSGETKTLTKGNVFIQRGTAHAWRNITDKNDNGGVLRLFFVFQPINKVRLEGGEVDQDLALSLHS